MRAPRPLARLSRFWREESGALASLEFVLVFPVMFVFFFVGMEHGLMVTRQVLLERSLDLTVRELRLGRVPSPDHDLLKRMICDRTPLIDDCTTALMLELRPISTQTWNLPAPTATCVDRDATVQPTTTLDLGLANDMMLIRACAMFDPVFPFNVQRGYVPVTANGDYPIVATSAFVNEPD
ncbi:MAG: pilus assembly protein [Rhodobacterales bacterium]|nr:pilus assembly protein [Rhodobacterales bacterium]